MRKLFLLTIFVIGSFVAHSQDLVITNEGDSMNCKITKVKNDYVYFTFKQQEEIRRTLLPTTSIKKYEYNYYATAVVPIDKIKMKEVFPRFRFSVFAGYSKMNAEI